MGADQFSRDKRKRRRTNSRAAPLVWRSAPDSALRQNHPCVSKPYPHYENGPGVDGWAVQVQGRKRIIKIKCNQPAGARSRTYAKCRTIEMTTTMPEKSLTFAAIAGSRSRLRFSTIPEWIGETTWWWHGQGLARTFTALNLTPSNSRRFNSDSIRRVRKSCNYKDAMQKNAGGDRHTILSQVRPILPSDQQRNSMRAKSASGTCATRCRRNAAAMGRKNFRGHKGGKMAAGRKRFCRLFAT